MTFRRLSVLAWMLGSLALVPLEAVRATEPQDTLLLVAGSSFPVDDISFSSVKSAFRGQRIQINGQSVIPINHPLNSPARVSFDRITLGLEPTAVGRFWIDMRIRDQGRPPTIAKTSELALRIAEALRGAITYAAPSTTVSRLRIKVLTVEGKSAGQPGYPLTSR
jgi:hypothetical protein